MSTLHAALNGPRGFNGIAQALRGAITRGELPASTQLPPIAELARRYDTTAVTVRRALRDLEDEGLIRVEHGVGTFVADWSRQFDLLHLPSFAAEMEAHDVRPSTTALGRSFGIDAPDAKQALGLTALEPVHVLTRLRWVGTEPIALQHSYLGEALREVVARYSPDRSLYEMVREATGRAPLAADETLQALLLPAEVSGPLELKPGAAGWIAVRTTFDAGGQPLVYDEAYIPSERVELHLRRRAGQTSFDYRIKPGGEQ